MNNLQQSGKHFEILLVEDNPAEAELTSEILKSCKYSNRTNLVRDGEEALLYLRREGDFSQAVRPDIIFTDLNLPRKNGHDLLAEIKTDPEFETIPVVVFSSSSSQKDIDQCYALKANGYVSKPMEIGQFFEVVESMMAFWLSVAALPVKEN